MRPLQPSAVPIGGWRAGVVATQRTWPARDSSAHKAARCGAARHRTPSPRSCFRGTPRARGTVGWGPPVQCDRQRHAVLLAVTGRQREDPLVGPPSESLPLDKGATTPSPSGSRVSLAETLPPDLAEFLSSPASIAPQPEGFGFNLEFAFQRAEERMHSDRRMPGKPIQPPRVAPARVVWLPPKSAGSVDATGEFDSQVPPAETGGNGDWMAIVTPPEGARDASSVEVSSEKGCRRASRTTNRPNGRPEV